MLSREPVKAPSSVIEFRSLTKSYKTSKGRHFVFRDVNAVIPSGRSVGILGPNGAGKSTLINLIGRIDYPDSGEIQTTKRISWPVGLSGGFQGSLSGRDNCKFVCRVYGLEGAHMRHVIDFVQDFAEIGEYFEQPVASYSNGMRSRLAFGLSMAFDFDYYLIDEVMAVGDKHFLDKSRRVFKERTKGANLIMVSHSPEMLKMECDIGLFVADGRFEIYENIADAVARYNAM